LTKQLTVFIENKKGSLTEVTKILKDRGINIFSFSLADTENFGLLRMVVTNPEEALEVLKENYFSVSITDVFVVSLKNEPGSLSKILSLIEHLDVQYMYMYANRDDIAGAVFKISQKEEALKIFEENEYELIEEI
jgi:hypothetical protein